jgi:hypothetical protein
MVKNGIGRYVTVWSVLGGLVLLAILLGLFALLLRAMAPASATTPDPTAVFVVIPAPTSTPPSLPTIAPTLTPTALPGGVFNTPEANEGIKISDYVQIAGTGGDGLRIRSGPGTQNPVLFLAMEDEVFEVIDGPKVSDGFTWWNLKAPYDEGRKGWAASNYLSIVAKRP